MNLPDLHSDPMTAAKAVSRNFREMQSAYFLKGGIVPFHVFMGVWDMVAGSWPAGIVSAHILSSKKS